MSDLLVKDASLIAVADALRVAGGTDETLVFPDGFVQAAEELKTVYHTGYDAGYSEGETAGYTKGQTEGFERGQKSEYDKFWDAYQDNGNRTNYAHAFYGEGWNNDTYNPKYDIKLVGDASCIFQTSKINKRVVVDTSQASNLSGFIRQSDVTEVGTIDVRNIKSAGNLHTAFAMCPYLRRIDKVIMSDTYKPTLSNVFTSSPALEEIRFEGLIFTSISFNQSSLLSSESVQSITDALADLTGQEAQTVTLTKSVKERMTDEQIAQITAKNWTLA